MADSQLTRQGLTFLKSLAKHFNRKFAEILHLLINHKRAGSLGALAGFAIAVFFTWKCLRSPVRRWTWEQKKPGSSSTSSTNFLTNEVSSFSENHFVENSKTVEQFDDFHSSAKFAVSQGVEKKLYGSRKEHATVRSSVVEVLLEISKNCDVYLMERILDDESGERVISALHAAGIFKTGDLIKDKVLFCSTENGRSSFVRQLEPDWHVDTDPEILSQLCRFVSNPLYISSSGSSFASGSNILSSQSLELYFAEESVL